MAAGERSGGAPADRPVRPGFNDATRPSADNARPEKSGSANATSAPDVFLCACRIAPSPRKVLRLDTAGKTAIALLRRSHAVVRSASGSLSAPWGGAVTSTAGGKVVKAPLGTKS